MSDKRLVWSGACSDPSGYGASTRGYLLALSRFKDIQTKLLPKNFWTGEPADLRNCWNTLSAMSRNNFDRRLPHITVQHLTPENYCIGAGACKYHIGMTTFETTSIPAGWQMNMRAMDEIFTFSRWSKEVMETAGIRRPITVIPHGVDIVKFNPGNEPLDVLKRGGQITSDDYVFGANFDWTERKNPLALLKAYYTAFKAMDPVVLVLKTYYQYPLERSGEYIRGYIAEVKKMMGLTKTPRIILLQQMMSTDELSRFYASLDCYVLPSRGEGFSMTHSEAMATGLPSIAVGWSGHTEFMSRENSILCDDFKMETISQEDAGAQKQYVGHQWASVNHEQLGSKMRWAFEQPAQARVVGLRGRETMVSKFTWAAAGQILKSRLDDIFQMT